MRWLTLPKPGTKYGPCQEPCSHTDCEATREMAATICHYCGQPIGYDTPFVQIDGGLVHVSCEYDRLEHQHEGS